jgi:hypothetical protein
MYSPLRLGLQTCFCNSQVLLIELKLEVALASPQCWIGSLSRALRVNQKVHLLGGHYRHLAYIRKTTAMSNLIDQLPHKQVEVVHWKKEYKASGIPYDVSPRSSVLGVGEVHHRDC